jgi:hypothetical protein
MSARGSRSLSILATAALLIANTPAKAAVFGFTFGTDADGAFETGAASPTDPGYDLVTDLIFFHLSGTDDNGNTVSLTNLLGSGFAPGAAFDPTTDAFLNHNGGTTSTALGSFQLNPGFISVNPFSFRQGSGGLQITLNGGNEVETGGRLVITGGEPTTLSAPLSATPLPAGLPLFATGLGALGLLGWRRKRKVRVSLSGAA